MTLENDYPEFFAGIRDFKPTGPDKGTACCPAHEDSRHSLSIGRKANGDLLFNCFAGCSFGEVLFALGIKPYQVRNPETRSEAVREHKSKQLGPVVASYEYRDESGEVLYKINRHEPKDFRPYRREGDRWELGLGTVRRVLYRLPELLDRSDETVYLVEGEKDADNLRELGLVATTNAFGAKTWSVPLAEMLRGRDVVILEDFDPIDEKSGRRPGEEATDIKGRSLSGVAKSVKVCRLSELSEGEDVSDWLEKYGSRGNGSRRVNLLDAIERDANPYDADKVAKQVEERAEGVDAIRGEKDPTRIGRLILDRDYVNREKKRTLRFWRGSFWHHRENHYQRIETDDFRYGVAWLETDAELERQNRLKIAEAKSDKTPETLSISESLVTNVIGTIKAETLIPDEGESFPFWLDGRSGDFLAMENGILNLGKLTETGRLEILPHSPDWFSPIVLPYPYDPDADLSAEFIDYIFAVMEGDYERINFVQEWFGYCLLSTNRLQKFLGIEGGGANGKSVFCNILTSLVGPQNVSNIPLEKFGDRFALASTIGKLVNISADTSEIDKAAEGRIKEFTAGDRMDFERKMENSFSAVPTARIVVAWNNRPRFSDKSDGLWRRLMVLPFNAKIPQSERRSEFAETDYWIRSGQMPGILNWALEGLERLFENGKFTEPEACKNALSEYRLESNPSEVFLRENYTEDENCETPASEIFEDYEKFCFDSNFRPTNAANFGREIRRIFPKVEKKRVGSGKNRSYVYRGIGAQGDEFGSDSLFHESKADGETLADPSKNPR